MERHHLLMARYQLLAEKPPRKPTPPADGTDDPGRARPGPTPAAVIARPRLGMTRFF